MNGHIRFKDTGEVRQYLYFDPSFEGEGGYAVQAIPEDIEDGEPPIEMYSSSLVEPVDKLDDLPPGNSPS